MKTTLLILVALAFLGQGCGSLELRTPERFKDKKKVEDPPVGMLVPEQAHA